MVFTTFVHKGAAQGCIRGVPALTTENVICSDVEMLGKKSHIAKLAVEIIQKADECKNISAIYPTSPLKFSLKKDDIIVVLLLKIFFFP